MHVLIAAHDFYPDPGSGGTGRYIHETSRRLVDRGHSISVVTRRRGDRPRREKVEGVDVYRYDIEVADRSAPEILVQLPSACRTIADHVRSIRATEAVDVTSFQGHVTALLVDRLLDDDVPRSITFHSPWPVEYDIRAERSHISTVRRRINVSIRRKLENRLMESADHLVALSEYMADRNHRLYGGRIPRSVIPGGVDPKRFSTETEPLDAMSEGDPAFLTVRRLSPRMGHDLLLRAFATTGDSFPDAHLYIAGAGPQRSTLESLSTSLGIQERTTFLGYLSDTELPGAYVAADHFVLPTRRLEGFGLATLEAMASGTPVIATPVGGTVEILKNAGVDGELDGRVMLVDEPSVPALAEALHSWGSLSPDRRRDLGRRCRRYVVDNYSWETVVDDLETELESIIG